MAKKSRRKLYKTTNVLTKGMGAAGTQVRFAVLDKIDAQGMTAYVHNVNCSVLVQEAEQDNIGFMVYATTSSTWNDDYIISARAGAHGKTVNLPIRRRIVRNSDVNVGNDGLVHLWLEFSDTIASEEARIVMETWGNFVAVEEIN